MAAALAGAAAPHRLGIGRPHCAPPSAVDLDEVVFAARLLMLPAPPSQAASHTVTVLLPLLLAVPASSSSPPPPTSNHRDCYGCIGWCTYGDVCVPPPHAAWHDAAKDINVYGRGWPASAMGGKPYQRFPAHAQSIPGLVHGPGAVWATSQRSAGLNTRFSTAAADLWVHWTIPGAPHGDWLWPSVGHCGIDIYVDDEDWPTGQRWATSSGNNPMMTKAKNGTLYTGLYNIPPRKDGRPRNFTVYLPLASATTSVSIAALSAHGQANVPLLPLPPRVNASLRGSERPVLWVGTSIMNGAAANRPGMGWPQQASRMLGMEGVNLGFGGLGLMQPFYAESGLLAEVNASIMVVDCEFNMAGMDPLEIANRTRVFLRDQRARRPDIPVLLLEGHDHGSAWINARARAQHNHTREAYRRAYNQLLSEGISGLYYGQHDLKFGGRMTATDFQAQVSTVAGVHPKPLGLRELATFASGLITAVLEGRASDTTPQPTGGSWPPPALPPVNSDNDAAKTEADEGAEWLSDAALEEERWRSHILGWSTEHAGKAGSHGAALVWTDARKLGVEGKGWGASASANYWQRLPDSAKDAVPAGIWHLSTQTSGILVRFTSNSSAVGISISRGADLQPNTDDIFTTNGKQGFDVHVQGAPGAPRWRWAATEAGSSSKANGSLVMTGLPPSEDPASGLNFTVYLPTYASVVSLRIGVEAGSFLKPLHLYSPQEKPILIWGSSIAQGGVVTNSGMTWPSNLQRIMDRPLLNFGFSGISSA